MLRIFRTAFVILMLGLAVPVAADPDKDADAAFDRGDYGTALRLIKPLADQGHAGAQYNLGVMFANGQGVPQNDAEAMKWYRLAANQGNARAQNDLGVMFATGQGVPQNYEQAHMWFNLAGAEGKPDGNRNRDGVAEKMTAAQIAEAQRLAAEWKAKPTQP